MFPQKHKTIFGPRIAHIHYTLMVGFFMFISLTGIWFKNFSSPQRVEAATSSNLNFQARIYNSNGSTVPDGYYNLQFKLYDGGTSGGGAGVGQANAGTNLWTESYYDSNGVTAGNDNRVRVVNGYFSVSLGSQNAFPSTINWDQELWMTMNVGGSTQTATPTYDGEMLAPGNLRTKLTGVPYAFRAGSALGVSSSNTSTASTNSSNVTIQTGNATGATSNSGNLIVDVGTATGTAGTISIGTATTSGISIGHTGVLTSLAGNISIAGGTNYGIYYRDGSGNIVTTAAGTSGQCFKGVTAGAPIWGSCSGTGDIVQDGNTLGTPVVIGSNDNFALQFETNNNVQATIAAGGATLFKNSANSTSAFQVQNAAGTTTVLNVDTANNRVGINTAVPSYELDVNGKIASRGATGASAYIVDCSSCTTTAANFVSKWNSVGFYGLGQLGGLNDNTVRLGNVTAVGTGVWDATQNVNLILGSAAGGGSIGIGTTAVPTARLQINSSANDTLLKITDSSGTPQDVMSIADGGATTFRNQTDSTTALRVQDTGGANILTADTTNKRIVIGASGVGTPTSQLYVSGTLPSAAVATLTSQAGVESISVQNNYAYVASYDANTLKVYDISRPTNPILVATSGVLLSSPEDIAIRGKYAYVANYGTDSLQVLDISNVNSISSVYNSGTSVGTNPNRIIIGGNYAYVLNFGANPGAGSVAVYDITNPVIPKKVGSNFTTGDGLRDGVLIGRYLYVTTKNDTTFRIIDVSNPASLSQVGSVNTTTSPGGLAVEGMYAYIGDQNNPSNIRVFDIKNPASPTAVTTVSMPTSTNVEQINIQGRYLYATTRTGSRLLTFDIANPAAPVYLGSVVTGTEVYDFDVQGRYAYAVSYTGNTFEVYDLGGAYIQQLETGSIASSTISSQIVNIAKFLDVSGGVNIGNGLQVTGGASVAGQLGVVGDIKLYEGANRTISVDSRSTNAVGNNLSVIAGSAGAGGSAFSGGSLTLQGGAAAGTGNANGGAVTIAGGTGVGTGSQGLVNLSTTAFSSASEQSFAVNTSITAGNVDLYSSLPVKATASGLTLTVPDPNQATIGRVLYVSARSGSNDFTLRLNATRTPIDINMKANSTATLIWNGTDWTAAGASSSTDLQAAYNNTLSSAGAAELLVGQSPNADGLTIRNSSVAPITGALLEVQSSIGSNLLSVNNSASEYAVNGGSENSTYNGWSSAPTGGTVSKTTVANEFSTGQAATKVVTAATAGQGVTNTLSAALTANLQYNVAFTIRGNTNFSTLEVVYSRDGTNASTTSCASAQTVTTSVYSRINCTFTAPASGITTANAIFIRQTDAVAHTYYIDNLSISVNASVNHASDGSADIAANIGAGTLNWAAVSGATVTQSTSILYDTSGSVSVATAGTTGRGVYNKLSNNINPSINTQYRVAFYARGDGTNSANIAVAYTPDNGTTSVPCLDYNTQTISSSAYTLISCYFTTAGTAVSNAQVRITQSSGASNTIYIDALTVTLNTNNANNVQIGGGNEGGPVTLFTLDRSAGAPIAANNDAYLGSMYYDTASGRIQCYEADGWGACGAAPDNYVNLNPEYSGAVLNGTGVGTMTADLCSNDAALSINSTLCSTGQAKNYYRWTSPQATQQAYSIYVTYQLPATFNGFSSDDTVQLVARTDSTANAAVTYEMFKSTGSAVTKCGTNETTVVTAANQWQSVGINGNEATGCSFNASSAGNFVIFKINLKANSNANAYVSTLSFVTTGR